MSVKIKVVNLKFVEVDGIPVRFTAGWMSINYLTGKLTRIHSSSSSRVQVRSQTWS